MHRLLTAIVQNDRRGVEALLHTDRRVVDARVQEAALYESGIYHWLYVGDTALHLAAAGHRVAIVRLLLSAGADPNAAANHRHSGPLHYAADGYVIAPDWDPQAQTETIRCLLEAGAAIDAQDKNGATPLHRAVRTRCAAAVECLLTHGADPRVRNRSGSTPFHLAVQNTGRGGSGDPAAKDAQRQIIDLCLAAGLSPALEDGKGHSVRSRATSEWVRERLELT